MTKLRHAIDVIQQETHRISEELEQVNKLNKVHEKTIQSLKSDIQVKESALQEAEKKLSRFRNAVKNAE